MTSCLCQDFNGAILIWFSLMFFFRTPQPSLTPVASSHVLGRMPRWLHHNLIAKIPNQNHRISPQPEISTQMSRESYSPIATYRYTYCYINYDICCLVILLFFYKLYAQPAGVFFSNRSFNIEKIHPTSDQSHSWNWRFPHRVLRGVATPGSNKLPHGSFFESNLMGSTSFKKSRLLVCNMYICLHIR